MRTAEQIVYLGTRPDYRNSEPIPGSTSSSGYLALSGEVRHWQCLNDDDAPSCKVKHRTLSGALSCHHGTRLAARTNSGELVGVGIRRIGASNGERAALAYPNRVIEES